ncbi:MAG: hypothetical protein COB01_05940 [Lutibacter sp.]|nr:MAG: hypothetical protein COB01_05940 [Lutibacter sp.]
MAIKFTTKKTAKKVNPLTGFLLLLTSIILFTLTVPFGIIYGVLYKFFTKTFTGLGEFSLKISISLDQLGNVSMQYLFNEIMIIKGGYKFGNRDETISSVIGKNVKLKKLSTFGKLINSILDFIDIGHSLNSIDYYIEPIEDNIKK